jgi:SAM-dependent methyltransferase/predicted GNAT family acetyltransferase
VTGRQSSTRHSAPPTPAHELTCEIRTLDTAAELIESYRLRYAVYTALGYSRRYNESKLEIDIYDSSSIPFGAFDSVSGTMIGTLRLVTTEVQPDYDHLIQCILTDLAEDELTKHALGPRQHPLPSMSSHEINREIEAFNTERFVVHELSRTIVHPSHRGMGVARGLVELGLAYASRSGPAIVVGGCSPKQLPMYAKFGCQRLPNIDLEILESVGQISSTIICRTDVLPQPTRGHVDELLRSMTSGATECTLAIGRDTRATYRHRNIHEQSLHLAAIATPGGRPPNDYVLESPQEFQRLEEQSAQPEYDFRGDLPALVLPPGARILDAGCGSGIVSRYLAERYPDACVTGIDRAGQRIAQATEAARHVQNLVFVEGDLTDPSTASDLSPGAFAFIVCRFVLEHLSAEGRATALARLRRSLAPGGVLCLIDVDGLFYNLYPTTERVRAGFAVLRDAAGFDLTVGRKLPRLLHDAGFVSIDWRAVAMGFTGASLASEARRVEQRLVQARPALAALLGDEDRLAGFIDDYLAALREPGAVLFYNRFVVTAITP